MTEREEILEQNENAGEEKNETPTAKEEKGQKKEITKLKAELLAKENEAKREKEEKEALNDKYLRLAAEYDNFRKRSAKEKEGIYSDAVSDIIKEVLPIFDNLERAAIYESAEKVAEGLA
ncbi:MAG: nucleotide exchange factor GrpE, partial [Clostridia bacterium]|nr:nucleotide exchange factor GrpE [Clostridia bacterium]